MSRGSAPGLAEFWNSTSSVSLRREMLTGELDSSCAVCKAQNVEPPEEVVPDIYMRQMIACGPVAKDASPDEPAGRPVPPRSHLLRPWPGSSVSLAHGGSVASRPGELELTVELPPGDHRPGLFVLRDLRDETAASARGIPMGRGRCLVRFEVDTTRWRLLRHLVVIAQMPGDDYLTIPWKAEDEVSVHEMVLRQGSEKYPVLSDLPAGFHLIGHVDECHVTGHSLRCKGWAFDTRSGRAPDMVALFSGHRLLATSGTKGERYDVAHALSAPEAVNSGFFLRVDLGAASEAVDQIADVAAIALFRRSHFAFLVGTVRAT